MNKGERRDGVGGAAVGASAGGTAAMCGQVRRLVFAAGGRHTALLLRAVFPLGTVGGGGGRRVGMDNGRRRMERCDGI